MLKNMKLRRVVGKATKLENQIEQTSRENCESGFIENVYGSFDDERLVLKLRELYENMLRDFPDERELRYAYAGQLLRFREFDKARDLYRSVIEEMDAAIIMLAMIEIEVGNDDEADVLIAQYNEAMDRKGMPFLKTTKEKTRIKKD